MGVIDGFIIEKSGGSLREKNEPLAKLKVDPVNLNEEERINFNLLEIVQLWLTVWSKMTQNPIKIQR